MANSSHSDVLILGGGVIGLACAYYLAREGVQVRVIERDRIGVGASSGNCGFVFTSDLPPLCAPGAVSYELARMLVGKSPLYIKPEPDLEKILWLLKFAGKCNRAHMAHAVVAREAILRLSRALYADLLSSENLKGGQEHNGVMMVCRTPDGMARYGRTNDLLKPYGLEATAYQGEALAELEPALRTDLHGAWYHPDDFHLQPEHLLAEWKALLLKMGVTFEEKCPVERLPGDGRAVEGVATVRGEFSADAYVVAMGAWSRQLARRLGTRIPVQPGKGYTLTMSRPAACLKIPCYMYETNVVATPWKDAYRLGGTMEFSGYGLEINRKRIDRIKQSAARYLKEPFGSPLLEERCDFRPMSYDDLPIIGRPQNHRNLFLATGHGMLGISMAPGTGKLISDLVRGAKPTIDLRPFSPDRF
ncbi:MAG: FAD-dependent oxidoreductase [Desulfobacterales bacterium]|nr:FAD-dependent oxidoreductase [Desulfobacterales bacterium]